MVHIPDKVVNGYRVISLVGNESAFRNRNELICFGKDTLCDSGIGDVGRRSQFPDRQAGDAVHKHMVFVAPVELEILLIMLIGILKGKSNLPSKKYSSMKSFANSGIRRSIPTLTCDWQSLSFIMINQRYPG